MKNNSKDKGNKWKDKQGSVNNTSDSNVYRAYQYFVNKGLTPAQASGIVGNLAQESTINLDSSIENSIGAYGIAQWLGSRRKNLQNYAKDNNRKVNDFDLQLDFIWHELNTTEKRAYKKLLDTSTASEAAEAFVNHFERSGEKKGDKGFDRRVNYANQFMNQFDTTTQIVDNVDNEVGNVVTSSNTLNQTLDSNKFFEEYKKIENLQLEEQKRRDEKVAESQYKQILQNKINERQFLTELIDSVEVPFIEAQRADISV